MVNYHPMDRRNVSTLGDPMGSPVLQLSVNRPGSAHALLLHHHVTPKKVGTGVGYDPKIQIGYDLGPLDQL